MITAIIVFPFWNVQLVNYSQNALPVANVTAKRGTWVHQGIATQDYTYAALTSRFGCSVS